MTTTRSRTRLLAPLAAVVLLGTAGCAASADPPAPPASAATTESGTTAEGQPLTQADVDGWLDGFLPAALDREQVPGASVAVVHDGEVVTARGYGWADRDERTPVDPDETLFRVGSVSKVVTATAVMQLAEAGEVDLDADVTTYVDVDLEQPVTLRHLLTHTGGFEERVRGLIAGPDVEVDLRESVLEDPPEQVYEPGTTPAYSNYGNALAGLVVEEVSGRPFESYVAERVLAPAGMGSSTFSQPLPDTLADRLASGYTGPTGAPVDFETVTTPPAGALTSSATDMAGFMLAQLGESPGEPLLSPDTLETMHTPALDVDDLGGLASAPRMTLGFFDRGGEQHRVVEHGGDTTAFHADLALWPDDGTGIFVALNGSGRDAMSTVALREQLLEGFADRYHPDPDPAASAGDADQAEAVAGTYESSRAPRSTFLAAAYATGQTTVTPDEDGRVLVSPAPGGAEPALYEPVGSWTWREVGGSRVIAADVVDGEVRAIGHDSAFALLPVPTHRTAGVLVPVVGGGSLVLWSTALGWLLVTPVLWLRRRRGSLDRPDRAPRTTRLLRALTGVGVAATVLALAGWGLVVTGVMGFEPPGTGTIRAVQALQLLGLLGVVPAALLAVDAVRRRAGWLRALGAGALAVALVAVAWGAVVLRLLAPDISY